MHKLGTIVLLLFSVMLFSIAATNNTDERFSKQQILLSVILSHIDEYHYSPIKYKKYRSTKTLLTANRCRRNEAF